MKELVSYKITHPGSFLKDYLMLLGMSHIDLSVKTGISNTYLGHILNGRRRITLKTAILIEEVIPIKSENLLRMQHEWDLKMDLEELTRIRNLKNK